MKVFISSYSRWWHPDRILLPFKYILDISDEDFYGSFLNNYDGVVGRFEKTWIGRYLKSKSNGTQQKIYVKVDRWDVWNMDSTLSHIVLPMLQELKKSKQGSPMVDSEDVPEELRPTEEPDADNGYIDNTHHERWSYVLDEMIWAFEQKRRHWWQGDYVIEHAEFDLDDTEEVDVDGEKLYELKWKNEGKYDREGEKKHQERMSNGFRLFGKYYEALWD